MILMAGRVPNTEGNRSELDVSGALKTAKLRKHDFS